MIPALTAGIRKARVGKDVTTRMKEKYGIFMRKILARRKPVLAGVFSLTVVAFAAATLLPMQLLPTTPVDQLELTFSAPEGTSMQQLVDLSVTAGTSVVPTATVTLRHEKETLRDAACGDGPVDAIYKAMERLTGFSGKLLDYGLRAVSRGKDAMGEVTLTVDFGGLTVQGRGLSTDIVEASGRAYLEAINRVAARRAGKSRKGGRRKRGNKKPARKR